MKTTVLLLALAGLALLPGLASMEAEAACTPPVDLDVCPDYPVPKSVTVCNSIVVDGFVCPV